MALLTTESNDKLDISMAIDSTRVMALQDAKLLGVDLYLPESSKITSLDEITNEIDKTHRQISACLQSIDISLMPPYLLGKTCGMILITVSAARHGDVSEVKKLMSALIHKIEDIDLNTLQLADSLMNKMENIKADLVSLRRIGHVEITDYEHISNLVMDFNESFSKQYKSQ